MSANEKKEEVKVEAVEAVAVIEDTAKVEEQVNDEKRTGIKEIISNSDAIAIEKEKIEGQTEQKNALPSFFIDKVSRHRVEVDVLSSKENGSVMSVSRAGMGLDFVKDFDYLRHSAVWFDFTIPTYEDMSSYRTRCASFRREAGQMLVDRLQLRNYILVWHLKDWSLTGADGSKVELIHDADGSLNNESVQKVYSLHPTIIDIVLTVFEKDILLT